jgi:hypothetical protein
MYDRQTAASRIAFSGIFDGSLKSGRPLEFGSGAGGQRLERTACLGLALQTVAQSAADMHDVPLPHDLPPAYC